MVIVWDVVKKTCVFQGTVSVIKIVGSNYLQEQLFLGSGNSVGWGFIDLECVFVFCIVW